MKGNNKYHSNKLIIIIVIKIEKQKYKQSLWIVSVNYKNDIN